MTGVARRLRRLERKLMPKVGMCIATVGRDVPPEIAEQCLREFQARLGVGGLILISDGDPGPFAEACPADANKITVTWGGSRREVLYEHQGESSQAGKPGPR